MSWTSDGLTTGANTATQRSDNVTIYTCCNGTDVYKYEKIGTKVWSYGMTFIIIFGTIGNVLSGAVVLQKRQRRHASSVYMLALAVVDTGLLFIGPFSRSFWGFDLDVSSRLACKFHRYIIYVLNHCESWTLASIAIERMVAVWWPMKVRTIFTRRVAKIQIAIIGCVFGLGDLHMFWTQDLMQTEIGSFCQMFDDLTRKIWDWVDMMLILVTPVLIMITCSGLIMVKIVLSRVRRASGSSPNVSRVTAMLVTVYTVFIICILPITIFLLHFDTILATYGCCYAMYVLVPALLFLMFSNNAVNFLLYCISGSKFRAELKQMLSCVTAKPTTPRAEVKPTGSSETASSTTRSTTKQ
jgi:hypothetical protein